MRMIKEKRQRKNGDDRKSGRDEGRKIEKEQ